MIPRLATFAVKITAVTVGILVTGLLVAAILGWFIGRPRATAESVRTAGAPIFAAVAALGPSAESFRPSGGSGAVLGPVSLQEAVGGGARPVSPPPGVVVPAIAPGARPWTQTNATWYCLPGRSRCTVGFPASCLCGAVSPDLRYLGHHVTVCAGKVCVGVRVVDCRCTGTSGLDLFAAAFRRLAPLSVGVLRVRVR